MTRKLESIVTWVPFGYGMIGIQKSDDPTTIEDPIIKFVHKLAVGGKYHNGEPILTPKEEKQMNKDIQVLIMNLAHFNHSEDFVKVEDDYNQPAGPRKRVSTKAVNQPDVVEKTRKAPETVGLQAPEKRPRGWNLRKGAKDTKAAEPAFVRPEIKQPTTVKGTWGGRRIKGQRGGVIPGQAAPRKLDLIETIPMKEVIGKGRKSLIDTIPLTNVKTARGGRQKVQETAVALQATPEKRPRGWNLRKGAKDTKSTVVPPVTEVEKPRRSVSRKQLQVNVPAMVKGKVGTEPKGTKRKTRENA